MFTSMKKYLNIIIVAILFATWLPRVNAQRPLRSENQIKYRASNFYVGLRGEVASSFYDYSSLNDQKIMIPIALNYGLSLEWRFLDRLSIGLEAGHSTRKTLLSFNTPYLTSYTTTAVTNITFALSERCLDASLPITVYFGTAKPWFDVDARPFLFAAPSVYVMYAGTLQWKRTHLIDNTVLAEYEKPISKSSSSDYDYGVKAGVGVVIKKSTTHYFFVTKVALSVYYGLTDTFSDLEKNNQLPVDHYYGLGDILHEQLGERHYRQVSLSCSFSMPLRKRPEAACRILGKY